MVETGTRALLLLALGGCVPRPRVETLIAASRPDEAMALLRECDHAPDVRPRGCERRGFATTTEADASRAAWAMHLARTSGLRIGLRELPRDEIAVTLGVEVPEDALDRSVTLELTLDATGAPLGAYVQHVHPVGVTLDPDPRAYAVAVGWASPRALGGGSASASSALGAIGDASAAIANGIWASLAIAVHVGTLGAFPADALLGSRPSGAPAPLPAPHTPDALERLSGTLSGPIEPLTAIGEARSRTIAFAMAADSAPPTPGGQLEVEVYLFDASRQRYATVFACVPLGEARPITGLVSLEAVAHPAPAHWQWTPDRPTPCGAPW